MGTVKWTPRALNDLQEIHDFIYRDSPRAAETFVDRLLRATERLASSPQSGRAVRDYVELGYREIIVATIEFYIDLRVTWSSQRSYTGGGFWVPKPWGFRS